MKKTKNEIWLREFAILAFRWEFLKRNSSFREAYKPIEKFCAKAPIDFNIFVKIILDKNIPDSEKIAKSVRQIKVDWQEFDKVYKLESFGTVSHYLHIIT